MLQYDDNQMADFRGYDLVHHDDLSYVASAHAECKLYLTLKILDGIFEVKSLCHFQLSLNRISIIF